MRAAVEHSIANLKVRWKALQHISLNLHTIGAITAATPILSRHENAY